MHKKKQEHKSPLPEVPGTAQKPSRRDFMRYGASATAGTVLLAAASAHAAKSKKTYKELPPYNAGCPIIDIHAHASFGPRLKWIPDYCPLDFEAMKYHQRTGGIQKSFVSDSSMYPDPYFEQSLLDAVKRDPTLKMWSTYVTWSGIYPSTESRDDIMERALKDDAVVGAKVDLITAVCARTSSEIVNKSLGEDPSICFDLLRDGDNLFEICAAAGKPVMCHTDLAANAFNMDKIVQMANRHPKVKMVVAHIGLCLLFTHFAPLSHYEELAKAKEAKNRNIYLDTSMYSLIWSGQIETLADSVGSDRMLFGTDSPTKCAASWVAHIKNAEMDEEHKKNIFYRTAEELFSIRVA